MGGLAMLSNITLEDDNSTKWHPLSVGKSVLLGSVMSAIVIGAITGNILVVMAVFTNRKLRTITNFYVVSLAMADLLVATLVMPVAIIVEITGRWWFGVIACDIYVSFDVMLCTASILNLCCISLDRYFAITKPLEYSTKRSKRLALIMIAVVWTASIVITCPPILGWREEDRWKKSHECFLTRDPGYVIYSSLGSFYIPLLVMSFVYMRIMVVASRRNKRIISYRRKFYKYADSSLSRTSSMDSRDSRSRVRVNGTIAEELPTDNMILTGDTNAESRVSNATEIPKSRATSNRGLRRCASQYGDRTSPNDAPKNPPRRCASQHAAVTRLCKAPTRRNVPALTLALKDRDDRVPDKISAKENKAAKTLAVVVGGFIVCWMPFFIIYTLNPFCKHCHIDATTFLVCTWLGYFNSMINPLIYACYNRDFRHTFWKLTLGRRVCLSGDRTAGT